ncbi:MAG: 4-(cytidine 5'-diphospho)-2-C-methyl-D-erythritol kinase [Pseudomonadota bacterium]|nr:4-(cytidine 5'-diphospho)-2-C-methyl-D-erythritol kinase [Pseudomonadota bacterium]
MIDTTLHLPAPAKLNLFLHITGRRADGYHQLQTVFQLIDACDWLTFTAQHDAALRFDSAFVLDPASNLVLRAARLLQQHSQTPYGCQIHLDKRLPVGGGIGGGSSDAATTLLALNHLWQLDYSIEELAQLGLQLGADVPVFVRGRNAWAEGVGEQLTVVDLPQTRYLVLQPDCFISTGDLFSQEILTRDTAITTFAAYRSLPDSFGNDCESVARQLFAPVAEALDYLAQFGQARLTGTGACVFLAIDSSIDAQQLLHNAPCAGFICLSLDQSPVHQQLGIAV